MIPNAAHASRDASADAASMPSLASWSSRPSNEMSAMSSKTVKPMPATIVALATDGMGTVRGRPPSRERQTSQLTPVIPTSFPTTSPATMPIVIGEPAASRMTLASTFTPALASANAGTMT